MGFVVPVVRAEKRARTTGYWSFHAFGVAKTANLQRAVTDRAYSCGHPEFHGIRRINVSRSTSQRGR